MIGKIPRISAKSDNNGILGNFDTEGNSTAKHFENFITVNFFGANGGVFYHPYKASVEMKVHTLKIPGKEFNSLSGNFIASSLRASLVGFGYGNQLSCSKLKNLDIKIKLPIKNGKIDFVFIENFMTDVKKTVTKKVTTYLSTTKINNHKFIDKQKTTPEKSQHIEWGRYYLGDLFDIKNTLSFNKSDLTNGAQYDYITRTSQNNGVNLVTGFINEENINTPGSWSLGLQQMTFFYRSKPWYAGQFVRKINPKIKLTKKSVLYFTSVLNKQKYNLLSVLVRDVNKTFLNTKISLPVRNDQIDFRFIDSFIEDIEANSLRVIRDYLSRT